jgi:hypothetical protein
MRKSLMIVSVVFALSLLELFAEDSGRMIQSSVPFAFKVDQKVLPAGKYRVEELSTEANEWVIRSLDGKNEAVFLTESSEGLNPAKDSVLVFEEVGSQHYLSGIHIEGTTQGWKLSLKSLDLGNVRHETTHIAAVSRKHS